MPVYIHKQPLLRREQHGFLFFETLLPVLLLLLLLPRRLLLLFLLMMAHTVTYPRLHNSTGHQLRPRSKGVFDRKGLAGHPTSRLTHSPLNRVCFMVAPPCQQQQ